MPEGTSGAPFPASLQPHGALRLLVGGFKTPSGRSVGLRDMVAQLKGHRSVHLGGHARIPSLGGKGSITFPCLWPTTQSKKRGERGFQKEAGRDGGNISVKLLRVLNKLHLSNIMIIFFFFSFLAKVSGKERRAVTILQFLLWAALEKKDVGGLGLEEGWGKQICPASEPRAWDERWKSSKLRTDYGGVRG